MLNSNRGEIIKPQNGLNIVIKPIPDCSQPGVLDPRVLAVQSAQDQYAAESILSFDNGKPIVSKEALDALRRVMNAVKSVPIAHDVYTHEISVFDGDHEIPIRVYRPKKAPSGLKPLIYYIHGGGFIAGNLDVVDELCKILSQQIDCIVASVQYRLAPEYPFPAGLDDCYTGLNWVHANAAQLGADANKLFIAGDSAGGNLATVCAMLDRDRQLPRLRGQILLYPCVHLARVEDPSFELDLELFEIANDQLDAITGMITGLKETCKLLGPLLGVETTSHPYISPYLGALEGMPPCLLLYAEFDYLRLEGEDYAHKLNKAGVPVRAVLYKGMDHGFADRMGACPQVEDCILEIKAFVGQYC